MVMFWSLRLGTSEIPDTLSREAFWSGELGLEIWKGGETLKMLHPLSPRPGPQVQVAATQAPLRDLRYTDVSIVDLGFKAKGTKSPFLVAANSSSQGKC